MSHFTKFNIWGRKGANVTKVSFNSSNVYGSHSFMNSAWEMSLWSKSEVTGVEWKLPEELRGLAYVPRGQDVPLPKHFAQGLQEQTRQNWWRQWLEGGGSLSHWVCGEERQHIPHAKDRLSLDSRSNLFCSSAVSSKPSIRTIYQQWRELETALTASTVVSIPGGRNFS